MDFNGDYPGSRVKRLKVDTTAEIGTDLTVHGAIISNGDIKIRNITATDVKTDTLETKNLQTDYANVGLLDLTGTQPILLNSTASTMSVASVGSDIEISPYGTAMATFTGLGTTFHAPVTCSSVGTVSDLVSTKCSLGTVSCSGLSATTLAATTQLQTVFGSTSAQTVTSNSFTFCTAFDPTPILSRGSPAVTLSGSTFTINTTGYYMVGYYVVWDANATGRRSACIRINGGPTNWVYDARNAVQTGSTNNMGSFIVYATSGTYMQIEIFQNSGSDRLLGNYGNQVTTISFTKMC